MKNKLLVFIFLILVLIGTQVGAIFEKVKFENSDSLSMISSSQNKCVKTQERYKYFSCMTESLRPAVKKYGVGELMGVIKKSLANNDGVIVFGEGRNCHDLTHSVGRSAGKYSDDVKKEILECDPVCGVGCYHGIMESMLDRTGSNFESVVKDFCDSSFEKNNPTIDACFHGLGHSIANYRFDEVEALKVCDNVSEFGQIDCAKGVFMELYHVNGLRKHLKIPLDKQSWCLSQVKKYQTVCWQLAGALHTSVRKNDFLTNKGIVVDSYEDEAIYYCSIAPEVELVSQCYEVMGLNLYSVSKNLNNDNKNEFNYDTNYEEISKVCHRAVGFTDVCIRGSISAMFESDPAGRDGEKICGILDTSDEYEICMDDVIERRQTFERNI